MYEVTISVPKGDEYLLSHIKQQTAVALTEMDAISTDLTDDDRSYFSVACSDTFRFQMKRLIAENVSDVVALGYKNVYMRSCLKVKQGNFFQNVLINTMCVFDKSCDQQIVSKIIDVNKPLFLDGYCNFRLNALKRKWKEITNLVSDNNFILHDEQLILEFLQYLLESVSCKVSQLSLSIEVDDFLMYDSNDKVLPKVKSLAPKTTAEEEAALNVLLLKPQSVTVYYGEKPSQDFCTLLQLFQCKFVQAT